MIRVIYRLTRPSIDIPWFQKDTRVEEILKKLRDEKKLTSESFVQEDTLVGYYTSYWIDNDSFNDYMSDSYILEWRLGKLIFQSETGSTSDIISIKEIL